MRVLIVEDDLQIAKLLKRYLESHNFVVDHQETVGRGLQAVLDAKYSAVIIDRMLPDGDGIELIDKLKERRLEKDLPPFLVLSALGDVEERVASLNLGAVDYVVKPYEPEELLARLKVCIKHKTTGVDQTIALGNIVYDIQDQHIEIDGKALNLRRRELLIFDTLVRHQGRVTSYRALEEAVYSYDDDICSNTLASQVSRLRKALRDANSGVHIKVLRNIGYLLELES